MKARHLLHIVASMNKSFTHFFLVVIIVFILSWCWEFILEPSLPFNFFEADIDETDGERWEYIITITVFCLFSLYFPTRWLAQKENEREELIAKLDASLKEVKILKGIIPICAYCKEIRDDKGAWNKMEEYIQKHSNAEFSHGICPGCYGKQMEKLDNED